MLLLYRGWHMGRKAAGMRAYRGHSRRRDTGFICSCPVNLRGFFFWLTSQSKRDSLPPANGRDSPLSRPANLCLLRGLILDERPMFVSMVCLGDRIRVLIGVEIEGGSSLSP